MRSVPPDRCPPPAAPGPRPGAGPPPRPPRGARRGRPSRGPARRPVARAAARSRRAPGRRRTRRPARRSPRRSRRARRAPSRATAADRAPTARRRREARRRPRGWRRAARRRGGGTWLGMVAGRRAAVVGLEAEPRRTPRGVERRSARRTTTGGTRSRTIEVMRSEQSLGAVARLARWCATHRRRTVVAGIAVLVVVGAVSSAVGARTSTDFALPGTESQRAQDLLQRNFPARAGDVDQIVIHARQGAVSDPGVRARVAPVLARIARLPHVAAVASPYRPGGGQAISRDGRIAFATVTFDEQAQNLPKAAIQRVMSTAREAAAPGVQVELGGPAIEEAATTSLGAATAIGLAASIVVLLLAFGSVVAAGLPVVTALLGLGTAFGVIGLVSHAVKMPDFSTELAAMIGLGVGIDYALFIVTRFRQNRLAGQDQEAATSMAMDTAGRAVLFAGTTVIVALLGMVVLGLSFLDGLAVAAAVAVLLTMLASLTILPALLAYSGKRVGNRRAAPASAGLWARWAGVVARHPRPAALAGLAVMLVVATPALSLHMGVSDAGNDASGSTTRKAYDLLAQGFGPGFNGPLTVVAQLPKAADATALRPLGAALRATPDVAAVSGPSLDHGSGTAVYQVVPASSPQATATTHLVKTLRST